jgi:pimeloyl-ACP methyl ester carboxylesterase
VIRDVVLVHGLWMPGSVMAPLGARLARAGYAPHVFRYRGTAALDANVERLARFAQEALGGRPAHYVGHSLGGIVVLEMLNRHPGLQAASAVLVGAPVRGSLAGRKFGRSSLGRWMMGACRPVWEARAARWTRAAPLGVIAGTTPLGLGWLVGGLAAPNDGVVCVDETEVEGMSARAFVRRSHSWLPLSAPVATLVARFLGTGRFA